MRILNDDIALARYLVSDFVPVELASFSVNLQDDCVRLDWTTASKTNNSHFLVERSKDNINFQSIGRVEGNGTTTELQHYSFTDEEVSQGITYFSLKPVESINLSGPGEYGLAKNCPNPFNPSTRIEFSIPKNEMFNVLVYNSLREKVAVFGK